MALNETIANLMLEKGRALAQGALGSGQAWGSALANIGQQVGGALQQQADPRYQLEQQQLKDAASAKQFQTVTNGIVSNLMKQNQDGTQTIDRTKAQQLLSQSNVPLSMQTAVFKQLDDMDASVTKYRLGRIDHSADIANSAIGLIDKGVDPRTASATAIAYAKANGLASDAEMAPLVNGIASAGDNLGAIKPLLEAARSLSEKYKGKTVVLPPTPQGASPAQLRTDTGDLLATGGTSEPKPKTETDLASDAATLGTAAETPTAKQSSAALQLLKAPKAPDAQAKEFLLDGKATMGAFLPDTKGGKYFYNGEDVSQRVKPMPPASVIVQQNAAAAAANAPPIDASRPTAAEGNKVNPTTGLTKNAEYQNALLYATTGKIQGAGMSSTPGQRLAASQMIQNKAAAIAAEAGVDLEQVQAEYRAHSAALSRIVPIATMTAASAGTAKDNLQLALDASGDVSRTSSKFVNKPWQVVQREMTPAVGLSQFDQYIYTAAREYAKVVSGSAASTQGLTDTAAKEATKLLSAAQAKETFQAVVQAMQKDMDNVTGNQTKQISKESGVLGSFFGALNGAPASQSQEPPKSAAPANASALTRTIKNSTTGETKTQTSTDGGVTWK